MTPRAERLANLRAARAIHASEVRCTWTERKTMWVRDDIRTTIRLIRIVDAKIAALEPNQDPTIAKMHALIKRIQTVMGHSGCYDWLDDDLRIWMEHARRPRVPVQIATSIDRAIRHITKGHEESPFFDELRAVRAWLESQR